MKGLQATYYDGVSALAHGVTVNLLDERLEILSLDGECLATWERSEVRSIDSLSGNKGGRLGVASHPEARLEIELASEWAALVGWTPELKAARPWRIRGFVLATGLALGALVALFFGLSYLAPAIAGVVPDSWDRVLGRAAKAQVRAVFATKNDSQPFCDAEAGRAVLDDLTKQLTAGTGLEGRVEVLVLRSPVVNAVAIPGNQIILLDKLIQEAETTEEVAGVLSHELGHLALRHPTAGLIKHFGLAMVADYLFGGGLVTTIVATMVEVSYSRDDEQEADQFGLERLDAAGISRAGLAAFFERLGKQGLPEFLSTHPSNSKRVDAISGPQIQVLTKPLAKSDLVALKAICGKT